MNIEDWEAEAEMFRAMALHVIEKHNGEIILKVPVDGEVSYVVTHKNDGTLHVTAWIPETE